MKNKLVIAEQAPHPTLDEKELEGKEIICYDRHVSISSKRKEPIFVAKGVISCQKRGHLIANIQAIVKSERNGATITIPIQKCLTCFPTRLFLSSTVLDQYESEHGPLYCRKLDDSDIYIDNLSSWFYQSSESLLYSMGYNVSEEAGLTTSARHRILDSIISTHQMRKSEIMKHIDMLIRMHQQDNRYSAAVIKWRTDLNYLAKWIDTSEVINGYLHR